MNQRETRTTPELEQTESMGNQYSTSSSGSGSSSASSPQSPEGEVQLYHSPSPNEQLKVPENENIKPPVRVYGPHDLPPEILLEVFSYLDYRELRDARRVCKRWKTSINDWSKFINHTVFFLERSSFNDTNTILESSTTPFTNIKLNQFTESSPPDYYFPSILVDTLTTLILQEGTFTWSWFKDTVRRLRFVQNLSLVKCSRKTILDEGWSQTSQQMAAFEVFRRRLKVLNIDLESEDFHNLNFYLNQLLDKGSALRELSITYPPHEDYDIQDLQRFTIILHDIITVSRKTLKSLKLRGSINFVGAVCGSLATVDVDVQQAAAGARLDLSTFHLEIVQPGRVENFLSPKNETIIINFLRTQPSLSSLVLPPLQLFEPLCVRFVSCQNDDALQALPMPSTLREFGSNQASIFTTGFFKKFSKLNILKVNLSLNSEHKNFWNTVNSDEIWPNLEVIHIQGYPRLNFLASVAVAFPNLVTLVVDCATEKSSAVLINDQNLQVIIQTLFRLKILKLKSCHIVTDTGIAGIKFDSANRILDDQGFYLEDKPSTLGIRKYGLPVSALRCLKELSLTTLTSTENSSVITDIGLSYGFRFPDLRKLEIDCCYRISDFGLQQLARFNPRLEHCIISSKSRAITSVGKTEFLRSLSRARYNAVKIVN